MPPIRTKYLNFASLRKPAERSGKYAFDYRLRFTADPREGHFRVYRGTQIARQVTLIAQRFSVKLSLVSVGRLLAHLGLTCQRPLFRAYQQDRSLLERWLKEEYRKIRTQAKREKAEIFFEDESGVRSDFHSGTTWAPKGKTPVVRGGVRAEVFLEFLKPLLHGRRRPIYLIVDGHPSHRSKKVKTYVESLQGKLRLFILPPYSPG